MNKRDAHDYSLIIALGCLLTLLIGAWVVPPAHSEEPTPVPTLDAPAMLWPLVNPDGTKPQKVRVWLTPKVWGSGKAAREWDARIPGLTVELAPCVAHLPCIVVTSGWWGAPKMRAISGGQVERWSGLTTYPHPGVVQVYLNRHTTPRNIIGNRRRVAMHEMGHALGLGHHDGPRGVMAVERFKTWEWEPSQAEVDVLAGYFA